MLPQSSSHHQCIAGHGHTTECMARLDGPRPSPGQIQASATKYTYLEQIAEQDGPLALAKGAMLLDELDHLANLLIYPPEERHLGIQSGQKQQLGLRMGRQGPALMCNGWFGGHTAQAILY